MSSGLRPTLCVSLLVGASNALAQSPSAPASPPPRAHHVVFYDEAKERVMVAGGAATDARRNITNFDDLWSFDGARWTRVAMRGAAVAGMRVALDDRRRVLAFGGWVDGPVRDLRLLTDSGWRTISRHPALGAVESGFVFDSARGRLLLFGGGGEERTLGEFWEHDGAQWSRITTPGPSARHSHVMVHDPRRQRTLLFGGMGERASGDAPPIFADTWEFDGMRWIRLDVPGPAPRLGAGAAFDSKRGRIVIFGGSNHDGVFNDLWSWDGTRWEKLAEGGPEPRVMGYIAYDRRRDRIVMFGGRRGVPDNRDLGDTWEWDGLAWKPVGR